MRQCVMGRRILRALLYPPLKFANHPVDAALRIHGGAEADSGTAPAIYPHGTGPHNQDHEEQNSGAAKRFIGVGSDSSEQGTENQSAYQPTAVRSIVDARG